MKYIQRLGQYVAEKKFGIKKFNCSYGYIRRVQSRNGLAGRSKTTTRQTTTKAYLRIWTPWIQLQRETAQKYGLVKKDGYLDEMRIYNMDETALVPESKKSKLRKHLCPKNAVMLNCSSLLTSSVATDKRLCTIFLFAPMSGWKNC